MLRRRSPAKEVRERLDLALEVWKENGFAWYLRSLTWGDPLAAEAIKDRQQAIDFELEEVTFGKNPQFLVQVMAFDSQVRLDALGIMSPLKIEKLRADKKSAALAKLELDDIALQLDAADLDDAWSVLPVGLRSQAFAMNSALTLELGGDATETERAIDEMGEALENAEKAVEKNPKVPDAHLAQAVVLMMCERVRSKLPFMSAVSVEEVKTEIRQQLDEAIRLDSSFGTAYMWRAAFHGATGDRTKAEADVAATKRLNPKLGEGLEQSIEAALRAAAVSPTATGAARLSQEAARRETIALLDVVKQALRRYLDDHPTYPTSGIENLAARLGPQGANSLRLTSKQLDRSGRILDGWGRPFVYRRTDGGFRLYSVGPDGRDDDGSGDDVQLPDK